MTYYTPSPTQPATRCPFAPPINTSLQTVYNASRSANKCGDAYDKHEAARSVPARCPFVRTAAPAS